MGGDINGGQDVDAKLAAIEVLQIVGRIA